MEYLTTGAALFVAGCKRNQAPALDVASELSGRQHSPKSKNTSQCQDVQEACQSKHYFSNPQFFLLRFLGQNWWLRVVCKLNNGKLGCQIRVLSQTSALSGARASIVAIMALRRPVHTDFYAGDNHLRRRRRRQVLNSEHLRCQTLLLIFGTLQLHPNLKSQSHSPNSSHPIHSLNQSKMFSPSCRSHRLQLIEETLEILDRDHLKTSLQLVQDL